MRGLVLLLVFALNLVLVSGKDDIRSLMCASALCCRRNTMQHFSFRSPPTRTSKQAASSPRRRAAVKNAIARSATPKVLGLSGTSSKWLEPNPIAGQAFWYRSYCAGTIRCYMGQRKHAYVHSKTGLNHAQCSQKVCIKDHLIHGSTKNV